MKLHEYQNRIVGHIRKHDNCILSVEMGLGKTAAVLSYLNTEKPKSCLIVAPKRVAETTWKQEAEKWGFEIANKMCIVSGPKAKRLKALADDSCPYKIISRDNLQDVKGWQTECLVLDELTSFKTPSATRSKCVISIKARKRIGLTGTFLANGAIDIYGQVAAVGLCKQFCGGLSFEAWRAINFHDALEGAGLQFKKWRLNRGISIEALLRTIKDNIFTLTAADYLDIPPVTHNWHRVELNKETRKAYDELQAFLGFELNGVNLTIKEGAAFAKLQTLCNGFVYTEDGAAVRSKESDKLEAVADFCEQCKNNGESVLLFYAYVEEAIWLSEKLKKRGLRYMSVKQRDFLVKWNNGEIDVLFAHPASAGHGLNLQHGGRIIVWSSLTYNYELYAQANARLARQGQTKKVSINYFMADDTCEAQIWKALQRKDAEQNEFIELTK